MAGTPPLSLSNLVSISVTVAPSAASANPFNQGLFIGPTASSANGRISQYSSAAALLTAGYTTSSPEYIAAQIYFEQTPAPQFIWIGQQYGTAVNTITINVAGTGWVVGDTFSIVASGGVGGVGTVTAATGGVPSAIAVVTGGTGYSVEAATTTAISPSVGIGLTLHITVIGETLLTAATACRAANSTWYGLAVNSPVDADNLALAEWADPLWQTTRYYVWSSDAAIPAGTTGNLALQLQALKLRVVGIYSTTQSGLYPNNIYAAAGVMGAEMGLNTGLADSFFTLAHKAIAGIAPEPLTQTQYSAIIAAGFNVYGFFGGQYQLLEAGFLSNGSPSFLWLNLAMLVANLQINILNILASNPAVPQTNAGEQLLIDGANQACATAASVGFLAGSTWRSATVLNLSNGDAVPNGYLNQAQPYALQSTSDRAAGKAMPIYCCITTAGAVQSLVIGVYTQL